MFLAIVLETAAASSPAPAIPPWWGAALGAGVGALGAGLVSSAVALINNRANRRQLDKQLSAQQQMLDRQLGEQGKQLAKQLENQIKLSEINNDANHRRDREEQEAELRKWQLEKRRDAYVDLVVAVEKVRDTVSALAVPLAGSWPLPNPLDEQERVELDRIEQRLRGAYESAFQYAQVVRLAGPGQIASLAERLGVVMTEYLNYTSERCRSARQNEKSETLKQWNASVSGLHTLLEQFIAAASAEVAPTSLPGQRTSSPAGAGLSEPAA